MKTEEIKKQEELSDEQLDNVAGGVDHKRWNDGPDPTPAV
jgi:hypothetical protein